MIIAIFTGKGFTKEMYDKLRKEVDWENDPIEGWISHAVGFDESGDIRIYKYMGINREYERGICQPFGACNEKNRYSSTIC